MSIFDTMDCGELQKKVLSGEIDADCLLKDLIEWVTLVYYNLFANLDTGEHTTRTSEARTGKYADLIKIT